jgi:hypothetical protein
LWGLRGRRPVARIAIWGYLDGTALTNINIT